jgi:putative DNA primase/helicase
MGFSSYKLSEKCLFEMSKSGVPFDGPIIDNGEIQRFSSDSKKNKKDEWYIAWSGISQKENEYLICIYGSWSSSNTLEGKHTFKSWDQDHFLDEDERKQLHKELQLKRELAAKKLQELRDEAAIEANEIWKKCENVKPSESHLKYCCVKKIDPIGVRFGDNPSGYPSTIIPLRNIQGDIRSLQFISVGNDGSAFKTFLTGGEKGGNFFHFGALVDGNPISVTEGYATGNSIFEGYTKNQAVVVAFDCHNLDQVTAKLRQIYPKSLITICGDDDVETSGNPGRSYAEEAAKKHQCKVLFPIFPPNFKFLNGKRPTDFNDLHLCLGLEEIVKQLTVKKSYLHALNIAELLSRDFPPRKLILDPWLPERGLAMIYAPRGIGKTFLSLSIAYAIACGESILRWKTDEPRKVLYIDGEMPAVALQERLKAISKSFAKIPPDPSYLRIVSHEFQLEGIHDIGSPQGQRDINDLMEEADLVILDNLSTLVRSGNENEADSWVQIQEWMLQLRKLDKAVLLIHHAGKNGGQRGTSKREDILDAVLSLKKPKNHSSNDGARFEVHFEKSRGFCGEAADPFEACLITNSKGSLDWNYKKIDGRDLEVIVSLYKDGMTKQRDLEKETGMALGKVNRLIKQAKEERLI